MCEGEKGNTVIWTVDTGRTSVDGQAVHRRLESDYIARVGWAIWGCVLDGRGMLAGVWALLHPDAVKAIADHHGNPSRFERRCVENRAEMWSQAFERESLT